MGARVGGAVTPVLGLGQKLSVRTVCTIAGPMDDKQHSGQNHAI